MVGYLDAKLSIRHQPHKSLRHLQFRGFPSYNNSLQKLINACTHLEVFKSGPWNLEALEARAYVAVQPVQSLLLHAMALRSISLWALDNGVPNPNPPDWTILNQFRALQHLTISEDLLMNWPFHVTRRNTVPIDLSCLVLEDEKKRIESIPRLSDVLPPGVVSLKIVDAGQISLVQAEKLLLCCPGQFPCLRKFDIGNVSLRGQRYAWNCSDEDTLMLIQEFLRLQSCFKVSYAWKFKGLLKYGGKLNLILVEVHFRSTSDSRLKSSTNLIFAARNRNKMNFPS